MALTSFLSNTCTITQRVTTVVAGEETTTDTAIYTDIKCHFYSISNGFKKTDSALNTDKKTIKAILEPSKTLVKLEMIFTLSDDDLGVIGVYLIESIKMNRFIRGSNDSIQLILKAIK